MRLVVLVSSRQKAGKAIKALAGEEISLSFVAKSTER